MTADQTPSVTAKAITQRDGSPLANSNCRMGSVATGIHYHAGISTTAAKMRSYTDDQSGGTDSGDARQAWDRGFDQSLTVRDGGTFDELLADLRAGRLVHIDVWHASAGGPCLSGSGAYGHTMAVSPDCQDGKWLVSDPWCSPAKWSRVTEAKLRAGAEDWGRQVYSRAATEPDYPTDGPGPRDPRVLVIVARIVRRLMDAYYPEGPEGPPPPADTGGAAPVLWTVTKAQPLEDVPMIYSAGDQRRSFAVGTDLYERPGGTKTGEVSNAAVVYRIAGQDTPGTGKPGWWLLDGGGQGGAMRWVQVP